MVYACIGLDSSGCVRSLDISGHAGFAGAGSDPACAAVSVLAKAYALTITEESSHRISGDVQKPGEFHFGIVALGKVEQAKAAGRVLLNGLHSVQREFPDNVSLELGNYTTGE